MTPNELADAVAEVARLRDQYQKHYDKAEFVSFGQAVAKYEVATRTLDWPAIVDALRANTELKDALNRTVGVLTDFASLDYASMIEVSSSFRVLARDAVKRAAPLIGTESDPAVVALLGSAAAASAAAGEGSINPVK